MVQAPGGEVLVYEAPDGGVRVEVKLDRDTVWLTQRQMSELFETTPENVLMHLKNIYADGELEEPATAKDFLAVRMEGKRQVQRQLKHYNLDAIISVGYRVNSRRGRALPPMGHATRCASIWCGATRSTSNASSTTRASWKPHWRWCARRLPARR